MKKFIIFMMVVMFSLVTNAQTALQTSKMFDNVYVGVNGGATTQLSLSKVFPVNAVAGVRVGKDFTPVFGVQFAGLTALNDAYVNDAHTVFKAINTEVNATLNLSNWIWGYKGTPRTFEVSTVTGLGWLVFLNGNHRSFHNNLGDGDELSAKTALELALNLGQKKAWRVYAQPGVYWNLTHGPGDAIQFGKNQAQLALLVGVDYKFKTSNGTHNFKVWNVGEMNDEINYLRDQLNTKPKTVVREVIKEVVKENTVKVTGNTTYVIFFAQGKSTLDDTALNTLSTVKGNVTVTGYASPEGSDVLNQKLSETRAQTVADVLTKNGVKVTKVTGMGAAGATSNRVVIVVTE